MGGADPGISLQRADNLVKNHVLVAVSLGLVPLPLFDMAGLITNQVAMIHALAQHFRVSFDAVRAKALVASLLAGSAPVLSVTLLSSGVKLIPGIGSLFGSGSVALSGGALTYAVGRIGTRHFARGGILSDLDVRQLGKRFRREVRAGRAVAVEAARDGRRPPAEGSTDSPP